MNSGVPIEMLTRLNRFSAALGELQPWIAQARRDIADLIEDRGFEERERDHADERERRVAAVAAVLIDTFNEILEYDELEMEVADQIKSREFWRAVATECVAAAETGV